MKVLVVEDERLIADSLKKGLSQENMVVDVAYDGEEGYDFALNEEYDVILLDLMLPFKNGLEITSELRKNKITTPILMLTAKGEVEDKVNGLNIGADDYLAKPFDFSEVLARVKALARRPRKTNDNLIKIDNLEINVNSSEVKLNNKKLDLSKKEFLLLEYFMQNKGVTLSKEKIMSNVWDFDSDILPNTVEVYVGYLRAKIGKDKVKTIRGFGYKFE